MADHNKSKMNKKLFFNTRILLIFVLAILSANHTFSQISRFDAHDKQRFHFGFSIGIDFVGSNLKTKTNEVYIIDNELIDVKSKYTPALNVGILASMRMGEYLDLQFAPEFSIAHDMALYYRFANTVPDPNAPWSNATNVILRNIECNYINFPLLIKIKSPRIRDICKIYVIAGGQVGINMMSAKNQIIRVPDPNGIGVEIIPIIKPYDVQVKGGLGFDFYTKYLKLTPEFKISCGVINLLENPKNIKDQTYIAYYTESPIYKGIQSLKSRTFTISLIFGIIATKEPLKDENM